METVDFKHKPVPYFDFLMAPYPQCNSTTNLGEDRGVSYSNGYYDFPQLLLEPHKTLYNFDIF